MNRTPIAMLCLAGTLLCTIAFAGDNQTTPGDPTSLSELKTRVTKSVSLAELIFNRQGEWAGLIESAYNEKAFTTDDFLFVVEESRNPKGNGKLFFEEVIINHLSGENSELVKKLLTTPDQPSDKNGTKLSIIAIAAEYSLKGFTKIVNKLSNEELFTLCDAQACSYLKDSPYRSSKYGKSSIQEINGSLYDWWTKTDEDSESSEDGYTCPVPHKEAIKCMIRKLVCSEESPIQRIPHNMLRTFGSLHKCEQITIEGLYKLLPFVLPQ
jgi:hypothetical protein